MSQPKGLLPSQNAERGSTGVAFIARQPIYDRSAHLSAYELCYQNDIVEKPLLNDAKADAFLNAFPGFGLDSIVGDNLAFVNVTLPFILGDYCRTLPKDQVVLAVSGHFDPADPVMQPLMALRAAGYAISVAAYHGVEQNPGLLELADYASLDFQTFTPDEAAKQLPLFKKFKIRLYAKHLRTDEDYRLAKEMGFEYFQGPCFYRPQGAKATRVPIIRLSTLRLVQKLQEPDLNVAELEKIVSQDLAISFKLLRYVNSAAVSLAKTVESIKHAIQMVGTERIRAWSSLLMLESFDDKPRELMVTALVRGKMAEHLAHAMGVLHPDRYFTVGLFSVVDTLLNLPMREALELLPFSKEIREALLSREGQMGEVLSCILAYELGDWKDVRCGRLDPATIRQSYMDSIVATRETQRVSA